MYGMTKQPISRRTVLGATAAATAVATVGGTTTATASVLPAPPSAQGSRGSMSSTAEFTAQALSALAAGEKSLFFGPHALVPSTLSPSTATWTIFDAGNAGVRAANDGYVSCSISLEVGSRITAVEYVISGSAHSGSVLLYRTNAETGSPSALRSSSTAAWRR